MIKALLIDFDGVLTDNKVYVDQNGIESVCCNRTDSIGLDILKEKKIKLAIVSTEKNKVVSARGKKLGIEVYQAVNDKGQLIKNYCKENKLKLSEIAFVGNDINDLSAFNVANIKICPSDAAIEIKRITDYVLTAKGGDGVLREIAENFSIIFKKEKTE